MIIQTYTANLNGHELRVASLAALAPPIMTIQNSKIRLISSIALKSRLITNLLLANLIDQFKLHGHSTIMSCNLTKVHFVIVHMHDLADLLSCIRLYSDTFVVVYKFAFDSNFHFFIARLL